MFQGNANILRGSVTVSFGASIAGSARTETTVAFTNAQVGDQVVATPAIANPNAAVVPCESPVVTTANVISISVANLSTATTTAGTAVVYRVALIKQSGATNV